MSEEDFHQSVSHVATSSAAHHTILYNVTRPGSDPAESLGHIKYDGTIHQGYVELTNLGSTLEPWHLEMGGTSKRDNDNQVGTHGEGMKLAALSLMRSKNNHSVVCRSGGFSWTFDFSMSGKLRIEITKQKSSNRVGLFTARPLR